jgi:hypothetical protein
MRKRFTAEVEMTERDMAAFIQILAAHSVSFSMLDVSNGPSAWSARRDPSERNAKSKVNGTHRHNEFGPRLMIHCTTKPDAPLPKYERTVLDSLRAKYGAAPFRKGEGSSAMQREHGSGASSAMTHLCRRGYLAPL